MFLLLAGHYPYSLNGAPAELLITLPDGIGLLVVCVASQPVTCLVSRQSEILSIGPAFVSTTAVFVIFAHLVVLLFRRQSPDMLFLTGPAAEAPCNRTAAERPVGDLD